MNAIKTQIIIANIIYYLLEYGFDIINAAI